MQHVFYIGQGTLFTNFELMFGEGAQVLKITFIEDYRGFLLAILPPGAFIGLGLIIALKNKIDKKVEKAQTLTKETITENKDHSTQTI